MPTFTYEFEDLDLGEGFVVGGAAERCSWGLELTFRQLTKGRKRQICRLLM